MKFITTIWSKVLSPALLCIIFFSSISVRSTAQTVTVTVDDIEYAINTSTGVAECKGPSNKKIKKQDLIIESSIDYDGQSYPVTSIGNSAFNGCSGFTGALTIPNSVTSIGDYAFNGCSGFTGSLTIPNSMETIGSHAFYNCSGFTGDLIIPNSVNSIGTFAFYNCTGFNGTLIIGSSVTSIGHSAFYGCTELTGDLIIPNSVNLIDKYAFYNCTGFNGNLIIGSSVTTIGDWAFGRGTGFNGNLIIGSSVTTIGGWAFDSCTGFKIVNCKTALAPTCPTTAFANSIFKTCPLIVPAQSLEQYNLTSIWSDFNNKMSEPTSIILEENNIEIGVGEDFRLTTTILPENAYDVVTWNSSSEDVATVSEVGKVRGISTGKASITASLFNGLSASANIIVPGIKLPDNIFLSNGETTTLSAKILPEELANEPIVWTSSNKEVATVDESGNVNAVAIGKATITATIRDQFSAQCEVLVYSMDISGDGTVLKTGATMQLTTELMPEDLSKMEIVWSSSDGSVASVDADGKVTAVKVGSAVITAALDNGLSVSANIYVADITLKSLPNMEIGDTMLAEATVLPAELSDMGILWNSSDTDCVTVSGSGEVKAIGLGSAVITASLAGFPEISASCTVSTSCDMDGLGIANGESAGSAVITEIPNVECYIIPGEISVPYGQGIQKFSVSEVRLTSQPEALKKVAYPADIKTNFTSKVVTVPYDPAISEISDGMITEAKTGRLVFVDMTSVAGTFSISTNIRSIGVNAFALCSGITSLHIADSGTMLRFESSSTVPPAFAGLPVTELYIGRNVNAIVSPFRANATLTKVTFGNKVTDISSNMFYDCAGLHEVTLPKSIELVGTGAFGNCTGLSQLIIEDSSNPIEMINSFIGCNIDYLYYGRNVSNNASWPSTLKSIETGRYVDTLRENEFAGIDNIYSLTIGVGMRTIAADAFKESNITKVIWMPNTPPTGYESISAEINYVSTTKYELDNMTVSANLSSKFIVDGLVYVFNRESSDRTCAVIDSHYNRYITTLDVPHKVNYMNIEFTVEEINDYALYCNKYYKKASVGDGITSIGKYALYNCNGIESAPYIGKSVKTIGNYAFYSCTSIPAVTIPNATEYLGAWSLAKCTSLKSVILGNEIRVIEEGCFSDDIKLKQLVVPANVNTIANMVFDNCLSLSYFEICDRTTTLAMGYSKHNDEYKPSDGTIGGLTTAGRPLFHNCPLKTVYIGGDISYSTSPADGYSPFYRNDYIEKVTIQNNETEISDNEFYGYRNLKEVIVGNDVERVGDYSFSGCLSLEYFTLGNQVKTIGIDAFSDCDKMLEFKSYNQVPPVCNEQAMDDINKFSCTLYVPQTAVTDYQQAPQWKNFFHIEGMETDIIYVEAITLDPNEWTATIGGTLTIKATIMPANVDNKSLSWSSSDISVATVDKKGIVTFKGEGVCMITARANDGSGISANCRITVLPVTASQITLNVEDADLMIDETLQLTATVDPENTTDKTVVWSSGDEAVATVTTDGLVTAKAEGTATITATCGDVSASCTVTVHKSSGVFGVEIDENTSISVYTLLGVKLDISTAEKLKKLTPGFYIINGKKVLLR